jgi:hypothetical protein
MMSPHGRRENETAGRSTVLTQRSSAQEYGNRNLFYLFLKNFGPTGSGKPKPNPSGTVSANGPEVTIPNKPNVTPTVAGRAITAPTPAVATGLAAGFNALGLPYVWGGGGAGAGPNNGCDRGGGDYNSCGSEIGFDAHGDTRGASASNTVCTVPGPSPASGAAFHPRRTAHSDAGRPPHR